MALGILVALYGLALAVLSYDMDTGEITPIQTGPWLFGLLLLTAFTYRHIESLGFVYEDRNWLPLTASWPMPSVAYSIIYAPFVFAQWLGGGQPWAYHVTILSVHVVNVLLVYGIARTLHAGMWALVAAAVFALHPLQLESVAYITGGREVIAGCFLLVALWACLDPSYGWSAVWRAVVIVLCVGLATKAKASAIMALPLVVYAMAVRRSWRTLAVSVSGFVLILAERWNDIHYILTAHDGVRWASEGYAAMQASALWRFAMMLFLPFGTTVDHDWSIGTPMLHMFALTALIAWSVVVFWHWRQWPVLAVCLGWVLLAVAPRFFLQTREILNEHQLYTPLIGVSLALGLSVQRMAQRVSDPFGPLWMGAGDPL